MDAHEPQMTSLIAAGQALETAAGDSALPEMEYVADQNRYDKLRVSM